jgi:hypothetical protein
MSVEEGSTPNFFASLIFTFSSINSLITSCRAGALCVEMKSSLLRCSMSKSVTGSPLTMQATVCARDGDAPPIKISDVALPNRRVQSRCENVVAMVIVAVSIDPS